jgi:tetratricopeptide (TPR) repeat protein
MPTSLQKGIESAKSGHMDLALSHLKDAIIEEPENANVWVWLAAIIEDDAKQTIFLKKALEIDPDNRSAQRGMAYIERKKTIPPRPGEKLSDYTRPIGLFKKDQQQPGPVQSAPALGVSQQAETIQTAERQTIPDSLYRESNGAATSTEFEEAKKKTAWLDIILYTFILLIFVLIGFLVGSTILNIELPFLSAPEKIIELPALPSEEGLYLYDSITYLEMKEHQGAPQYEDGIPTTNTQQPGVLIKSSSLVVDGLMFKYEDGSKVSFSTNPVENGSFILIPDQPLLQGLYCIINPPLEGIGESQYWCFRIY